MKQTFTLFTAFALSTISAFAQINQTFEIISNLTPLTNNCWQFNDVVFSTENGLNDVNSLEFLPTTNSITATIVTPYANLSVGSSISFNYKLSSKLSNSANRTINIRLQGLDGSTTLIGTFTLNKTSPTTALSFSGTSLVAGIKKIVIEISGTADGNSSLFIDNLSIDADFNYNSPYGCNTTGAGVLPIKLKSFQGLAVAGKTQLQWSVTENENGNFFEVEKSYDGKEYKTIGIVATTQKQGDEIYSYKNELSTAAYYRLRMVSKSKTIGYSNVVFIKKETAAANSITLLQNPVKQSLQFTFLAESNQSADITIYSMTGIKVYQTKFTALKGNNNVTTSLKKHFSNGAYLVEVKTIENRSIAKFLKD